MCWTDLCFLNATLLPITKKSPFFSSDESEEEEDHRKKFKIKIKPLLADRVVAAPTVDELKASIGNISLSPSPVVSHPDITALTLPTFIISHLCVLFLGCMSLLCHHFSRFGMGCFFVHAQLWLCVLSTCWYYHYLQLSGVSHKTHVPPHQKPAACCIHHSQTANAWF